MRQPVVRPTVLAFISDRDWRRGPLPVRDSADFGCEFVEQNPKLSSSKNQLPIRCIRDTQVSRLREELRGWTGQSPKNANPLTGDRGFESIPPPASQMRTCLFNFPSKLLTGGPHRLDSAADSMTCRRQDLGLFRSKKVGGRLGDRRQEASRVASSAA